MKILLLLSLAPIAAVGPTWPMPVDKALLSKAESLFASGSNFRVTAVDGLFDGGSVVLRLSDDAGDNLAVLFYNKARAARMNTGIAPYDTVARNALPVTSAQGAELRASLIAAFKRSKYILSSSPATDEEVNTKLFLSRLLSADPLYNHTDSPWRWPWESKSRPR